VKSRQLKNVWKSFTFKELSLIFVKKNTDANDVPCCKKDLGLINWPLVCKLYLREIVLK
jgi:hypothetical protein